MFYTIISKTPKLPYGKNKLLLVFILGSVLYLLLHYKIWSKKPNDGMMAKVQKYFYFAMAIDFIVAYFLINKQEKEQNKKHTFTKGQKKEIENDLLALKKSRQRATQLPNTSTHAKSKSPHQPVDDIRQHNADVYKQKMLQSTKEKEMEKLELEKLELLKLKKEIKELSTVAKNNASVENHYNESESGTEVGSHQSPFKTLDEVEHEKKQEEEKQEKKKSKKRSKNTEPKSASSKSSSSKKHKSKREKKPLKQKKVTDEEIDDDTNIPVYMP